jgi:GT2 family glycosyltransferase
MDRKELKAELQKTRLQLQEARAEIEAMQSSKFWRLRSKWFKAKGIIRRIVRGQATPPSVPQLQPEAIAPTDIPQPNDSPAPPPVADPMSVAEFWALIDPAIAAHFPQVTAVQPKISILTPTFNSALDWFAETVLSVLQQTSSAWEWCLVDDGSTAPEIREVLQGLAAKHPRIKVALQTSGGISTATNHALAMAEGAYVGFLDHDDTLTPNAVQVTLDKITQGFDLVYSDEDKIDLSGQNYIQPFFKPDWSPEYFRGVMYVGHFLCIRRERVTAVGGCDRTYDGVQDYELVLRLSEQTQNIGHIPQILYHWRQIPGSVSHDAQAKPAVERLQEAAVNAHLKRVGLAATAHQLGNHRLGIQPQPKTETPLISIVISAQSKPGKLKRCLESVLTRSTYPNVEVILIDHEQTPPRPFHATQAYPLKRLYAPGRFNRSSVHNLGTKYATGDYILFLNSNTEVITPDWLEQLLYYAEQPHIGAVGALILNPDRTVRHAGMAVGIQGTAGHLMQGFAADWDGYAGSLVCAREVSAIAADCLMMKRSDLQALKGFNEHFFTQYQDLDLCMRLVHAGKKLMITPRSILTLHPDPEARPEPYDWVDRHLLLDQWQDDIDHGDPCYNRNFDQTRCDYSVCATTSKER